jgi:hypothetical protein
MRLPDISVEYVLAVFVRSGLGLLFGLFMGLAGLIVAALVSPGGLYSLPLWLLVTAIAIGCSISGSLSYYKPETSWDKVGKSVLIVVAGALIGAWIGVWWGDVFYPEGVRNERLVAYGDFRSPPNMARITWSAIGSTVTGGVYYMFRAWRYHEV